MLAAMLYQNRTFAIDQLEGFRGEFHRGPDGEVDELFFHEPDGSVGARRTVGAERR